MAADPQPIVVSSPTLRVGQPMPREHTADGRNTSPAVMWRGAPGATKQLVVSFQDDDEMVPPPLKPPFLHWVVYNIPPEAKELPAGIPFAELLTAPPDLVGAAQAYTAFSYPGYRGPQPPPGDLHHYRLTVFALDRDLMLKTGLFANAVLDALADDVIGKGELAVTYRRAGGR
jgi:hypothetical protein